MLSVQEIEEAVGKLCIIYDYRLLLSDNTWLKPHNMLGLVFHVMVFSIDDEL